MIDADFVILMDKVRVIGGDHEECIKSMYMIATIMNYLGEQNTSRKIREASQFPGIWTGAVMETDNKDTYLSTYVEKVDETEGNF